MYKYNWPWHRIIQNVLKSLHSKMVNLLTVSFCRRVVRVTDFITTFNNSVISLLSESIVCSSPHVHTIVTCETSQVIPVGVSGIFTQDTVSPHP